MNRKTTIALSTAAVLSAIAGVAAFSSPAYAFTLSGDNTLALSGSSRFNIGTGVLDFQDSRRKGTKGYGTTTGIANVTTSSSDRFEPLFGPLFGQLATLKDVTLTNKGANIWEFVGLKVDFITVGGIKFDLSVFKLVKTTGDDWFATFEGQFQDTGLTAFGAFAPLKDSLFAMTTGNGSSYSLNIEEVPTPALLPGLIGLGVAALRRKNEESAEENA